MTRSGRRLLACLLALTVAAPVRGEGTMVNTAADLAGKTLLLTIDSDPGHRHWFAFDPSGLLVHTLAWGGAEGPSWNGTIMNGYIVTGLWLPPDGQKIAWVEDAFVDRGELQRGHDGRLGFTITRSIDGKSMSYDVAVLPGLVAPKAKPPRRGTARVTVNGKTATGPWIRWDGVAYGLNNPDTQPGKATVVPDPVTPGATCVWVHDPETRGMLLRCPASTLAIRSVGERPPIPEPPVGTRAAWKDEKGNTVEIVLSK